MTARTFARCRCGPAPNTAAAQKSIEGLSAGQKVVASGQFLIDSEANLRGAFDGLSGSSHPTEGAKPESMPVPAANAPQEEH